MEIRKILSLKYPMISAMLIDKLLEISHVEIFHRNQIIIPLDKTDTHIYYILNGATRGFVLNDGIEKTITIKTENNFFGCHNSVFHHTPSKQIYQALEETTVLKIPSEIIFKSDNFSVSDLQIISFGILEVLSRSFARLEAFSALSPQERYLQFQEEHPELIQRINHKYLASYIGITPVSLSRIRSKLVKKKLI